MQQEIKKIKTDQEKYALPPDILNLSPEDLNKKLIELSQQAINQGKTQIKELIYLMKILPSNNHKRKELSNLVDQAGKTIDDLISGLAQSGLKIIR